MPTDAELLRRYLEHGDERAFEEVVSRHLGVVYSAALRRTNGRSDLAEDISQKVFSSMARHARALVRHPALVGWLYRCTHNAARDAMRTEFRRERLAQSLSAMPDEPSPAQPDIDWDRLRPFLDRAIDQLKERDRDIILLRFFSGLNFAAIGERLNLDENTARMRATRALDKLHAHLGRQGVTSTTAALGLLLANSALASAPAGLASAVSAGAVASATAGSTTGIVAILLMSKITAPLVSATVAAGLVTAVWYNMAHATLSAESTRLHEENARLIHVMKADDFSRRAAVVAQAIASQHAAKMAPVSTGATAPSASGPASSRGTAAGEMPPRPDSPRGHRWAGQATAENAGKSFAWACDVTDVDAIAKLIWFEPELREQARAILATMPAAIQADYPTPEEFYAFVMAADALVYPPPVPETFSRFHAVELREGRIAVRKEGSAQNYQEYQQTSEGWKYVVPARGVERWPNNLNNELLVKLGSR